MIEDEVNYILQTYSRPELIFERGEGVYLYDSAGKRYLDFAAGIAVMALGHADPEWVAAVAEQAALLTHTSNLYLTAPQIRLAKMLIEWAFPGRLFFCNSGTEANEGALKFARKWAKANGRPAATAFVAFDHSFHGRTMGALSVTHKAKYRQPFEPLLPGVAFAQFNDLASAEAAITDQTCAVIVEPVQGEGGVYPAEPQFLQGLRQLCDQHQALLIFDEVQCGLGRTGDLWAHQTSGVIPDMMTLAKPLAGGLPIGAIVVGERVAKLIEVGDHGSTFGGGALVCRAAEVVLGRLTRPGFLSQVQENGAYLQGRLKRLENEQIVAVRGRGLMVGVEFQMAVAPLVNAARDKGLLLITAGEKTLRLVPPLIISREQIDEAVAIIEMSLNEIGKPC